MGDSSLESQVELTEVKSPKRQHHEPTRRVEHRSTEPRLPGEEPKERRRAVQQTPGQLEEQEHAQVLCHRQSQADLDPGWQVRQGRCPEMPSSPSNGAPIKAS